MDKRAWAMATLVGLLAAAVATGGAQWWRARQAADQLAFAQQRLIFLESETRRLQALLLDNQHKAEATDTQERRGAIESSVERLRSLKFLRPVVYREIPRTDLPAILQARLGQQIPDQEFGHTSVALAALGLIPQGTDLKKTYLGLLGEQVGAFYDQHSQELFTFSGQGLASTQNQVILAHELTHALEDQHFNLARLPLEAKGNDDRVLAASALVEGDATLVMNRYMVGALSTAAIRESLTATVTTDVRRLAAAPRFLRETLLFPYLRGQAFCQVLYEQGGWPALARAFEHPPASSSLILHPERYLEGETLEPAPVIFSRVDVFGTAPIDDNVLGEFGTRQWLLEAAQNAATADNTAAGWMGDRYLVYGDGESASYVWDTRWRSPAESVAFATAADLVLGGGPGSFIPSAPSERRDGAGEHATIRAWERAGHRLEMLLDSTRRRVVIINAQDQKWCDALRRSFFGDPATAGGTPGNRP